MRLITRWAVLIFAALTLLTYTALHSHTTFTQMHQKAVEILILFTGWVGLASN